MKKPVTIESGHSTGSQLTRPDFVQDWQRLHAACPWATVFQTPTFVISWYEAYAEYFAPVIVSQRDDTGRLCGLFTLAISRDGQRLVAAGDHQAEYQVWLSLTTESDFIGEVLSQVHRTFPGASFSLKYLPPNTPLDKLLDVPALRSRVRLKRHLRPLMRIDAAEITASLQKKSNKSRINRLKRIGEVTLERITDATVFESVFNEIITQYDFRQTAVNNVAPFREDACKRPFHLELLRRDPNLLHVTVLKVSGNIIAAHIGLLGRQQVHLSIVAHSPTHGPYSPGKLLLLFLGKRLGEEGVQYLDLTPGGDPWKERFANQHDEVYELNFWSNRSARTVALLSEKAYGVAKRGAALFGIRPQNVKSLLRALAGLRRTIRRPASGATQHTPSEMRIFSQPTSAAPLPETPDVHKDSVSDLLDFAPPNRLDGTERFFADALRRLESGEHVYTLVRDGRLRQYVWVTENSKNSLLAPTYGRFRPPEGSALLYDIFTDPDSSSVESLHAPLARALSDVRTASAERQVFVAVPSGNTALNDVAGLSLHYEFSVTPLSAWERLHARWRARTTSGDGSEDRGAA
jgi:CelD/BcsL family acetyltransferase involved in cellulose biosynthesis